MYLDFSAPIGVFGVPPYTPPPKMCQKWCKIVLPKLHRKIHYLVGARAPRHTPGNPENHPREPPPNPDFPPKTTPKPHPGFLPHQPSVSFDGSKRDGSCTYSTDASSIIVHSLLYLILQNYYRFTFSTQHPTSHVISTVSTTVLPIRIELQASLLSVIDLRRDSERRPLTWWGRIDHKW